MISKKQARFVALAYTLVYFLQIAIKLLLNIPLYGSLGSITDITLDLIYQTAYFLFYMVQLLIVWLFATTDTNKYLRYIAFLNGQKSKKGKSTITQPDPVLPFTKFFTKYNPLQISALKMSLLILAVRLLTRILNDVTYGAPTSFGEVLVMIVYYLSDLLYALVAYVIALLVFSFIYSKTAKKADEVKAPSASEKISAE